MNEFAWMVPLLVVLPLVGAGINLAASGRTRSTLR